MNDSQLTHAIPDWKSAEATTTLRDVKQWCDARDIKLRVVPDSQRNSTPFHPEPSQLDAEVVDHSDGSTPGTHILAGGTITVVIVPIREWS